MKTIYYVYLSNDEHKELIIYYFLLNALKYQDKIFTMRNLKCVNSALKLAKHVSNECHKLKGFIRFKEINKGSREKGGGKRSLPPENPSHAPCGMAE